MWHTVRAEGCLSVNQVVNLQGSKTVVNLTRNYQLLKEDFTPSTYLQTVKKLAIDLRLIFSSEDTCESTIHITFPVFSSIRHTFIHTTGNCIIFCISLKTVKKLSINVQCLA
jgi:hypothetical protein